MLEILALTGPHKLGSFLKAFLLLKHDTERKRGSARSVSPMHRFGDLQEGLTATLGKCLFGVRNGVTHILRRCSFFQTQNETMGVMLLVFWKQVH